MSNIIKSLFVVLFVFGILISNTAAAAAGDLFNDRGTIYFVNYLGQKRGFPSPEIFHAHGFQFSQARLATAADLALPTGPVMGFPEGALVKSKNNPTVYVISRGQKRAFTSASSFLGSGYSFTHVINASSNNQIAAIPEGGVFTSVAGLTTGN